MTRVNFSNKPDAAHIERKLLPRLKLMGYIFFVLSLASLFFVLTFEEPPAVESEGFIEEEELELSPTEVLNFYVISLVFASLGTTCLLLKKKRAKLLTPSQPLCSDEEV